MLYCFQSSSPQAGEGWGEGRIVRTIAQVRHAKIGNDAIAIREGRLRYSARYRLLIASLLRNPSIVSR